MPGICLWQPLRFAPPPLPFAVTGICQAFQPYTALLWNMPGICHMVEPFGIMPQVDPKCLEPGYGVNDRLPLQHLQVGEDCDGQPLVLDMLPAPLAIAALVFHPCNWGAMHKRAEAVYGTVEEVDAWLQHEGYDTRADELGVASGTALLAMSREALAGKHSRGEELHAALQDPACTLRSSATRVYSHPFTCDKAIAAQEKVDAMPDVEGERNLNIQLGIGSDKCDVSLREGKWPQHLKVTNIELAEWFKRTSKVILHRTWEQRHMPGISTAHVVDVPHPANRPRPHPRGDGPAAPAAVPPLPGCAAADPGGVCPARHQSAAQVTSPPPSMMFGLFWRVKICLAYAKHMPGICLAYARHMSVYDHAPLVVHSITCILSHHW